MALKCSEMCCDGDDDACTIFWRCRCAGVCHLLLHSISLTRFSYLLFHFLIYRIGNAHSYASIVFMFIQHITDDAAVLLFLFFSFSRFFLLTDGYLVEYLVFGFLGDQLLYFGRLVLVFGLTWYNLTQPLYYYRNSCKVSQIDIPYREYRTINNELQEDAIFYIREETWSSFVFILLCAS